MIKEIVKALSQIKFATRYKEICNRFCDFDNGKSFNKIEVVNILNVNLNYSSSDKTFYRDYSLHDLEIRFSFTFKYGFIECFYTISNNKTDDRVRGRFNTIAAMENDKYADEIKYNFPIATDINDLKLILHQLIELHENFISTIESYNFLMDETKPIA